MPRTKGAKNIKPALAPVIAVRPTVAEMEYIDSMPGESRGAKLRSLILQHKYMSMVLEKRASFKQAKKKHLATLDKDHSSPGGTQGPQDC